MAGSEKMLLRGPVTEVLLCLQTSALPRYDRCFDAWYRQGFLRHQLNNPCDPEFEDFDAAGKLVLVQASV